MVSPMQVTRADQTALEKEVVSWPVLAAILACVCAAWIAAGAAGLYTHAVRKAAVILLLVVAQSCAGLRWRCVLTWVGVLWLLSSSFPVLHVLAVALLGLSLVWMAKPQHRSLWIAVGTALAVYGVYRWAMMSIPWFWWWADYKAGVQGKLVGWMCGHALHVGPVFAGFDMLMLTTSLALGVWFLGLKRRPCHALNLVGAILFTHVVYLVFVAWLVPWGQSISEASPLWHKSLPWHAPLCGVLLHALLIGGMLRWTPGLVSGTFRSVSLPWKRQRVMSLTLALLFVFVTGFHYQSLPLDGKKIVFYEKGFLNWLKPEHGGYGRLSSGMYGMLPRFLRTLGARPLISEDLSEEDLSDAQVVVLLFPDEPWQPGQQERLWSFVRQGGTLLVMGEHTTADPNGANRFNEILEPTAMRVAFDSGTFAVGGWLQSYDPLWHPATAGIDDRSNDFGVVIGASLEIQVPARPLLVGRWGWSDAGDPSSARAMMGNGVYDSGEKLGDLVLAAEQPLGKGRVVVFGDTSGLTNGINVGAHEFNTRLFSYLANGSDASPAWRQVLGMCLCALVVVLLYVEPSQGKLFCTVVGLTLGVLVSVESTERTVSAVPDGGRRSPNNLAYIDHTHMPGFASESWRENGVGGLALTLMRHDFVTLNLRELTRKRLSGAGLLICAAPGRAYSRQDLAIITDYVLEGGLLIITAGCESRSASYGLLETFGFGLGAPRQEGTEPRALGHFKSPYLQDNGKRVFVRFYAAWPVFGRSQDTQVLAYGADNLPVAAWRPFGLGKVVVIGDSEFVTNKNLEYEDGRPFEGLRENADFWRWLLSWLRDQDMWVPPALSQETQDL